MNLPKIKRRIKPWMLPIAMAGGILFHEFIEQIAFLSSYLIFAMLLLTFCKIDMQGFKATRLSAWLLSVQIFGALATYFLLLPIGEAVAQGVFMCIFCPVATAAPVITGMLGGNVSRLTAYSIISNISVALLAPFIFAFMNSSNELSFTEGALSICIKVMPMILVPLILALAMSRFTPQLHKIVARHHSLSFYIWSVALFIVVGRAVTFVMNAPANKIPEILLIAILSGIVCCLQFYFGRKMGSICGDTVVGGQGLGQKNTILAIWMTLTYLDPIASVGAASYVFWQNIVNSWQLYRQTSSGKL